MALHITSKTRPLYVPEPVYQRPTSKDELKAIIRQELRRQGPDADLNHIDISDITDMSWLFCCLDVCDIKIDSWNVSNVLTMESMFNGCDRFTGTGLDKWDTSNVVIKANMFRDCDAIVKLPRWYTDFVESDDNSDDNNQNSYWNLTTSLLWSIVIGIGTAFIVNVCAVLIKQFI